MLDFTKNEQKLLSGLRSIVEATSFNKASSILGIQKDRLWRLCSGNCRLYLYEYEYLNEKIKTLRKL